MKIIQPHYNVELNWMEVLAEAMDGTIDHQFIKGNNQTYQGIHYILPIEKDITAMLEDTLYKEDVRVKYTSTEAHFVGLYFYSSVGNNISLIVNNVENNSLGQLEYNLSIVDSDVHLDYIIEKETKVFTICIFIKKNAMKTYFKNIPLLEPLVEEIFNRDKNTIIRLDRMSPKSALLIDKFKKVTYDNPFFEFHFKALTYHLLSEYLSYVSLEKIIISKAIDEDFRSILSSKSFLLKAVENSFPGIDYLAQQVSMSPSKYKKLFVKITGYTPGVYFHSNKLYKAKELLATGQYTIGEVSEKLNYSSISYLAKRFKEAYGIFPKEYQNML